MLLHLASMSRLAFFGVVSRNTPSPLSRSPSSSPTHNNNSYTILGGSVLAGEEHPPHSGELNHVLSPTGGPTQPQLSRLVSSGHHISTEHRLPRKQLNSDSDAKERKMKKEQSESGGHLKWPIPNCLSTEAPTPCFSQRKIIIFTTRTSTIFSVKRKENKMKNMKHEKMENVNWKTCQKKKMKRSERFFS